MNPLNLLSAALGAVWQRGMEMFGVVFLSLMRAEAVKQLGEQQEQLLAQARRIEQEHGDAGRSVAQSLRQHALGFGLANPLGDLAAGFGQVMPASPAAEALPAPQPLANTTAEDAPGAPALPRRGPGRPRKLPEPAAQEAPPAGPGA